MYQALSAAARCAVAQERNEQGKVLWLLADACSMMLSPSSTNEPFKPYFVGYKSRSVISDDFLAADIAFFAEIVAEVDDHWLKARLSDLIWLKSKRKPGNTAFALMAIDAYCNLPLDAHTWNKRGDNCWRRAISLARLLKSGAGDRLEQMETLIVAEFNATGAPDGYLAMWLAELLKSNRLGRMREVDVASKLELLAHEFGCDSELYKSRDYFSAAADWWSAISDVSKAADVTVALAESWVKEAIARSESDSPSHTVAASCYEKAIQTYRTVPRTERARNRVDERIATLRVCLKDSNEKSLGEMALLRSPAVDITKLIQNSRDSVTGKSATEALLAFSNLCPSANEDELRSTVLKSMRKFPLQSLFASTYLGSDGQVVAKRAAMTMGMELKDEDETPIRAEMIRHHVNLVGIQVQGVILPALEVLLFEHRLREADFIELARHSPIVPKERYRLFGKALFAGFERDFVTALHLLVPQIEHLVRFHLKQAGATTTNLDKFGIQNEIGLSKLMELPEIAGVFGRDLTFEFKSLFCDAFGPNLRNQLAHGLLDEAACESQFVIYAWWLALRITINTWWNAAHEEQ